MLVFTVGISVGFGTVKVNLSEVLGILFNDSYRNTVNYDIVWKIRLPRALAALIGGCALAGLLLQIFFKNPIVEPYVLGISSGATLFVGLMFGYICSAVTNVLMAFADKKQLQGFIMWTKGSFSGFTWIGVKVLTWQEP